MNKWKVVLKNDREITGWKAMIIITITMFGIPFIMGFLFGFIMFG